MEDPIIIAGAGPVGAVAAYHLARGGVPVTLLEAGPDCAADLRASTFHPPTLEMLDTLGIADELIARGLKAPVFHWRDRRSGDNVAFDMGELAGVTPYPYRVQCEQYHLSRMLTEKLAGERNAEVLFGRQVVSFAQDDAGVVVRAQTATGIEEHRGAYLIGCDGAGSVVRKRLGIDFDGFTYPEKFLCLTTTEPLERHLADLAYVNYVSDESEWLVLLRVPSLWRVLVPADPDADDTMLLSDANRSAVFDRLIGKSDVATDHRTIYRVHQRVARRFRDGRVIIIGDAAHVNNPLGGFGMNSGIHDAFNLCPRLADIVHNGAPADAMLDAFEAERGRITRDFVQRQTIENMQLISMDDAAKHAARRRKMEQMAADPVARRRYLLRQSMIESVRGEEAVAA